MFKKIWMVSFSKKAILLADSKERLPQCSNSKAGSGRAPMANKSVMNRVFNSVLKMAEDFSAISSLSTNRESRLVLITSSAWVKGLLKASLVMEVKRH